MTTKSSATSEGRWLLYRLLAEPTRLRLLALLGEEELSVGELAELIADSQPNVSRHTAALRQGGLIAERRQGTRTYLRLLSQVDTDAVIKDAIGEGRRLCIEEGKLEQLAFLIKQRDASSREYFERQSDLATSFQPSVELPAYVMARSRVSFGLELAVDVGTGSGAMLDVLAPSFRRVVAIDRSPSQLERAEKLCRHRGYDNVELISATMEERAVRAAIGDGADAVFATRVLHHAPVLRVAMASLAALLRPSGTLLVLDYAAHGDESFREQRADQWLGFSESELYELARAAGLVGIEVTAVPSGYVKGGPDEGLGFLLMSARRP